MFFIPVNEDVQRWRSPAIACSLIAMNSLIWIGLSLAGKNAEFVQIYGLRPVHWTAMTLFASMFLHAGLLHIVGNMWFLWMFAPKLEETLGHWRFIAAYLICGIGAAALQTLFNPMSTIPMVGASGAISGLAGMFFLLFPDTPFRLEFYLGWWHVKSFKATTRGAVGVWIAEQALLGIISSANHSIGGVAFWAHVGGFAAGLLIGALTVHTMQQNRNDLLDGRRFTQE